MILTAGGLVVTTPFSQLLERYENGDKKKENFDKKLQEYGLVRTDVVRWNYDVELEVGPFEGGHQ